MSVYGSSGRLGGIDAVATIISPQVVCSLTADIFTWKLSVCLVVFSNCDGHTIAQLIPFVRSVSVLIEVFSVFSCLTP